MRQSSQNQGPWKRIFYSRLTLVLLAVVLVFMISGTWGVYQKASLAREQKERLEQELVELEKRRADLEAKLNALTTERGIEEEIRERYSVAKKGESVVVIVDSPEGDAENTHEQSRISAWWKKLTGIFRKD